MMSEDKIELDNKKPFFRKIDLASFWTATIASFLVYFVTLGPSVGLEDSGELAVAGDHLGVPHPPGYPIWTIISYIFARIFSFVTFRGQPNPAWAIALSSAVFGALAAGCTAMLITRSASDMLSDLKSVIKRTDRKGEELLCWVGGVAGSLIFAFSPVMWSQSTIVEVYSLGAFFLMLVMLLTYRWMRRPQDKVLWLAAFVFGLGLTNYQVLLLAALPLIVIIFLRNIALFRDFILVSIPIGLYALILKLGSLDQQTDLVKHRAFGTAFKITGNAFTTEKVRVSLPSNEFCTAGAVVFSLAFVCAIGYFIYTKRNEQKAVEISDKMKNAAFIVLSALFAGSAILTILALAVTHTDIIGADNPAAIALVSPVKYVIFGACMALICGFSVIAALFGKDTSDTRFTIPAGIVGAAFLIALITALSIDTPVLKEQFPAGADLSTIPTLGITFYNAAFFSGFIIFLVIALSIPGGYLFAAPVAAVELIAYFLVLKGAVLGLTHPTTWWFIIPVIFNFFVLGLAAMTLPSGRSVAMTFLMGELGVSFYIYMPIASDLRNPPMNWGYPRTWEGFKHAITRGQYEKIEPTNIFAPHFISQLGDYFTDLRRQFTLILAPFGFLPFCAWKLSSSRKREDSSEFGIMNSESSENTLNSQLSTLNSLKQASLALAIAAGALVLWAVDSFVPANLISDSAASFLRIVSVLTLLAAIATAIVKGIRPVTISTVLIAITVLFVILGNIGAIERGFDASRIDKLTFAALLIICTIGGIWMVCSQLASAIQRMLEERKLSEVVIVSLVVLGSVFFAFGFLFKTLQAFFVYLIAKGKNFSAESLDTDWTNIFKAIAPTAPVAAVVLPVLLSLAAIIGFGCLFRYLHKKNTVKSTVDDISQQWLIGSVCNFVVMSIILIMLANPKGDLQDTFIQKVKFISSHGLFALWIGYGLIFAVVVFNTIIGRIGRITPKLRHALLAVAAALVLLSSLIPIQQNYFNERLVFELSGAEQNGHDYGWQFGNYQLRGADAITEELTDDEEPLPNPSYPPAMGEGAIFFGGTDPGRFVPTYMIYSADVRPDVFLITQNALADNTFMSVTRDLYGDQIWIPTPKDSENAFQIYIDEVKSGKRPPSSDISIQGGRVQVVGALGVMEINGILCKMIFDHNKPGAFELRPKESSEFGVRSSEMGGTASSRTNKEDETVRQDASPPNLNSQLSTLNSPAAATPSAGHEFYVEESYVIPWMYPYLTPHGLIMHINPNPTSMTAKDVNNDMDFWDWYTRRITRDNRYRRDVVAQKSFSKLRSAIAGLYMNKGRYNNAELAYNQARILYPVSPEANFRTIQDVLLAQGRFDEALDVVNYFCEQDPNNDRGPYVRNFILDGQKTREELNTLIASIDPGEPPTLRLSIEIAKRELALGNTGSAHARLVGFTDDPKMSVGDGFALADILHSIGDVPSAKKTLDRVYSSNFVMQNSSRLSKAIEIYISSGDMVKLTKLMPQYLKLNPGDWRRMLEWTVIQYNLGMKNEAFITLRQALSIGGEQAIRTAETNEELYRIATDLMRNPAR